jgi:signal transduction histidine kinase
MISILLVEDNVADANFVREILPPSSYEITHVTSLLSLEEILVRNVYDVILLDLSLPDQQGLQTFIATMAAAPKIPIIILTGLDDEELAIQAVKRGAQDYIPKRDIYDSALARSIRYAIEGKQSEVAFHRLALLEQREEFMTTLTHDLKNPLIGTNAILEQLAFDKWGKVSEEQATLFLQLRDSNKFLLSMIQNLIEVYRFEKDFHTVVHETTDLLELISSCINEVSPIAKNRQISLQTDLPNTMQTIMADTNSLRRVLNNLFDNALKFTPSGGTITLKVAIQDASAIIEIENTGPFISGEEKEKLFQRFTQGKIGRRYSPGTGLGLYLCKQIIDAHSGKITCESTEGIGTVFRIVLPTVA